MKRYGIDKYQYHLLIANLTHTAKVSSVLNWVTKFLVHLDPPEDDFGLLSTVISESKILPRTLMGPLPFPKEDDKILEAITKWIIATPSKQEAFSDFFGRFLNDLTFSEGDRHKLFVRVQKRRRVKFPNFKWRSNIIRQLKNKEKLQASLLYCWARQGVNEKGKYIPDLHKIVQEMHRQKIVDGPVLVNLDKMRTGQIQLFQKEKTEWNRDDYLRQLTQPLQELMGVHKRGSPLLLLQHIYKFHATENRRVSCNATNIKREIKKALLEFHPDKVRGEDMLRLTLCEEITKCLTNYVNI